MTTWVTYDSREIDPAAPRQRYIVGAGFADQAAAVAAAAADPNAAAYAAAVADDAEPGLVLTISGAGAGGIAQAVTIPAVVARRRAAALKAHGGLERRSAAALLEGATWPATALTIWHEFLYRHHQAVYLMAHRDLLPIDRFEAWCGAVELGPSDAATTHIALRLITAGGIVAPTVPCAWVRWGHTDDEGVTAAIRVPLRQALAASGPATVEAPGNLGLVAGDLPDDGLPADGSWIHRLTS